MPAGRQFTWQEASPNPSVVLPAAGRGAISVMAVGETLPVIILTVVDTINMFLSPLKL